MSFVCLLVSLQFHTDKPLTQLGCYQLCQFISSLENFKHFFFPACVIFPFPRLGSVWKGMLRMGGLGGRDYNRTGCSLAMYFWNRF